MMINVRPRLVKNVPYQARRALIAVALLLACLVVISARETPSDESRIIGGNPVEPGKYQEYVSITAAPDNFHFCGGTLIRPDVVLTAAHCVVTAAQENGTYIKPFQFELSSGWEDWRIFKGDLQYNDANTKSGGKEMQGKYSSGVKKIVYHSEYDPANDTKDIALIFLKDDLPGPFARLPKTEFARDSPAGAPVTVVGFGITNNYFELSSEAYLLEVVNNQKQLVNQTAVDYFGKGYAPPVLYGVTLSVGDADGYCKDKPASILCLVGDPYTLNSAAGNLNGGLNAALEKDDVFGKPLTGHCSGDSGGPAFDENGVQVGVNSYVQNFVVDGVLSKCSINFTTKSNNFTKVREYLRWIRSTIVSERLPFSVMS